MRYISVRRDGGTYTIQVCRDGLTAFMQLTAEDTADLIGKTHAASADRKQEMLGADIGVPEIPEDDMPF